MILLIAVGSPRKQAVMTVQMLIIARSKNAIAIHPFEVWSYN